MELSIPIVMSLFLFLPFGGRYYYKTWAIINHQHCSLPQHQLNATFVTRTYPIAPIPLPPSLSSETATRTFLPVSLRRTRL